MHVRINFYVHKTHICIWLYSIKNTHKLAIEGQSSAENSRDTDSLTDTWRHSKVLRITEMRWKPRKWSSSFSIFNYFNFFQCLSICFEFQQLIRPLACIAYLRCLSQLFFFWRSGQHTPIFITRHSYRQLFCFVCCIWISVVHSTKASSCALFFLRRYVTYSDQHIETHTRTHTHTSLHWCYKCFIHYNK